jgi:hypothetical protein
MSNAPVYRLHKSRGCAVVTINGRNFYLGKHGSPESYEKYSRLIRRRSVFLCPRFALL